MRVDDGSVLGHTPWYTEQPRGSGTVDVAVRKSGYLEERVTLDRAANTTLHVHLHHAPTSGKQKPTTPSKSEEDDLDVKPLE